MGHTEVPEMENKENNEIEIKIKKENVQEKMSKT